MTAAEIANEKAELNAWVAEKVMGWKCSGGNYFTHIPEGRELETTVKTCSPSTFRPTEILEQALEALDKYNMSVKDSALYITITSVAVTQDYALIVGENLRYHNKGGFFFKRADFAYQIVKTIKEQSEVKGG